MELSKQQKLAIFFDNSNLLGYYKIKAALFIKILMIFMSLRFWFLFNF